MSDRHEHRLRRALRYYPRHYRERHGEEIVATALELADPADPASLRTQYRDLVRAGLATRWRERPPMGRWLLYRLFDVRVPFRYRMWARDDLLGRRYWLRRGVSLLALHLAVAVPLCLLPPRPTVDLFGLSMDRTAIMATVALLLVLTSLPTTGRYRRRMLDKHDFHHDGTPVRWRTYRDEQGTMRAVRD